ncbi:OLC1v1013419C1 [Oldenlandia corymbosa var. corymbosa]|uniref:OLC1v1013419C1 n=1 Tax=Oldenlandia corymbosa var. corymbosa TaxID=529605 RepID=A0AAV1DYF9_OLDCO|nr:OLC1v1013419C1 [Oldenlandia corymbosa var. corymbosa]
MASISPSNKFLTILLTFLALFLLVQSRQILDDSDTEAVLMIQKGLGIIIPSQRHGGRKSSPCSSAGIFCERRISNNSYVLRVTRIVYKSRQLKGVLSPAIGKLSELKELSLPNNKLVDQIPPEISNCRKLEVLDLKNNQLSGSVPPELSSLVRLRVLDLSLNQFEGNLRFLKHFPNLEKISLADNLFSGKIPPSLRSFRNLRYLNVSGNHLLEGPLPVLNEEVDSSLAEVTGIYNDNIPKRYVFAENSTRRNQTSALPPNSGDGLGSNLGPAPSPTATITPHKHKKGKKKVAAWALGFFAGTLAGSATGLLVSVAVKMLMFLIKGGKKENGPAIFSPLIKKAEDLAFLENEEQMAALEVIGRGGSGVVYKAELPGSNGKMIAIKKVMQPPKDAAELAEEESKALGKKMRQIKSEIQTVGQIRHRNLVPLLAHIPRPDCHYLVYEFMKNGSLQDILQRVAEGEMELDWLSRHRIALDFGLAKAMPEAFTHVTSSNVVGTLGYIAPEYHQTLKFTDKCDIYSYGVLLASLVMGKLPSDRFFQETEEMRLVHWMRNVMTSEDPKRAIDPKLLGNGYEEQMLLVLKIAFFCTLDNPKERPNSKDVRAMLSQIKHEH